MRILYFDDFCPLCRNTVIFLKKFVKPKNVIYQPISKSELDNELKNLALKDMLIETENRKLWGYETYIYLFSISKSKLSILFRIISFLIKKEPFKSICKIIYRKVADNRLRCSEQCKL